MSSILFSKIKVGKLELNNRIVVPPMCQYSAAGGLANDWHLTHYVNMAFSGAGLVIFEATAISPEGRISYADLGLWDNQTATALKRIVDFIHLHTSTPLALQISHAGRKGSNNLPWNGGGSIPVSTPLGWQTYAPSAISQAGEQIAPKELTKEEIQDIIQKFAATAGLASDAGFDAIEIHAAHGYLVHQFLSPITNQRTDEYGGNLENRIRFALDIVKAIKANIPDKMALGIRISATDWIEGGWDLEQSLFLAKKLEKIGIDFIHTSSGGLDNSLQKLPQLASGYQLPFAETIKQNVQIPVIGVGLITDPLDAEQALKDKKADMIAIGRGILFNPRWAWHAASLFNEKMTVPAQYLRCAPHGCKDLFNK